MNERQIAIVKLLMQKEKASVKDVSNIFNVSARTIRNDLNAINLDLNRIDISSIKNDRGNLSLSLAPEERKKMLSYFRDQEITFFSPEERILFIIIDFLNYPKQIKIYEEQEKLKVSKSTIDNDIRNIRKYLHQFSLKLNAEHGVQIVGDEKNIRTMIQQLVAQNVNLINLIKSENLYEENRSYELIRNYLGGQNLKKLYQLTNQFLNEGRYADNLITRVQITISLSIWFRRITQQYFLTEKSQVSFATDKKISKVLKEFLAQNEITVPQIEIVYISYLIKIFIGKTKYGLDEVTNSQLLTLKLINFMSQAENIDYNSSEQLYEQLNSHLLFFLGREKNNVKIYNPLTSVLKSNYSRIFKDIKDFFFRYTKLSVSEYEIAFITVYFGTYFEKIIKQRRTYRIAVLCNFGEATGQLLAANLSQNLKVDVVGVFGSQNLDALPKLNIDFIVKTIDEKITIPSIKIHPIPTREDYKKLDQFIQKLPNSNESETKLEKRKSANTNILRQIIDLTEKLLKVNVNGKYIDELELLLKKYHINIDEREMRPLIEDIITNQKISLGINAQNWHEAIEEASRPLLENKSIESSYIDAMEKSVDKFGPYIVIGPHIALAHARPEDGVNKLDVSVATLKHPIDFGNEVNDPVKIIFVLAAIDNYSHLNILKAIVNLINDQDKINRLCKCKDINEFKKILFQKVTS